MMLGVPAVGRKAPPAAAANNADVQILMRAPETEVRVLYHRAESIQRWSTNDWEISCSLATGCLHFSHLRGGLI